jgi:hypothetical protein
MAYEKSVSTSQLNNIMNSVPESIIESKEEIDHKVAFNLSNSMVSEPLTSTVIVYKNRSKLRPPQNIRLTFYIFMNFEKIFSAEYSNNENIYKIYNHILIGENISEMQRKHKDFLLMKYESFLNGQITQQTFHECIDTVMISFKKN